jgi:Ca-activated chloride channel family protein
LCYHEIYGSDADIPPSFFAIGAWKMKVARFSLLLALCIAIIAPRLLPRESNPFPSYSLVQDSSAKQKPSSPRQKSAADDSAEEDRPQGKTAISVAVDLVNLQVLVTDPKNNVITGLRPENFAIYEDNVKQEITNFAPIEADITVVMLVEFSRQISGLIYEVLNAVYTFANSLRSGDWVAVIGYDIRPTILCDFSRDRNELQDALKRFNTPAFIESNLSDALIDTLDRVEEIEGKVAVLLVSTGLDTFSKHTYQEALAKCKQANASIYAISIGQTARIMADASGAISPLVNMELLMSDNRLRSFAEYTGGEAFFPRFETELPSIFNNISIMLRNQYSIAYMSSNTMRDAKYRKISVEVNSSLTQNGKPVKLKALTRKGYQARAN